MGALKKEHLPSYTYADYCLWEGKWELIYGIPYAMSPAPMIKHQHISHKIAWQLQTIFEKCELCQALLPVDWKISDETIVQPDNLVICHKPTQEAYINQAPVIIFEILSKSTSQKDLYLKYELYEKEGVNYYIIIDPNSKVAKIYRLLNGKYIKVCDTVEEIVAFELNQCKEKIAFDFSKIW
ncbi:MAG: Uma2 family endonuclease [Campylobacteraceae bacterium]|nr:Uma2 family endonuclease [Campylobacteraceae bacterium]